MDPVQALLDLIADIRTQTNTVLSGLPPLEQFEASSDLSYGIRSLTTYGNSLRDMLVSTQAKIAAARDKISSDAKVTAEAASEGALIAKGEFIRKTDSEAAVQAAVSKAETDTRSAIQAEMQAREKIATRRAQLVTDKTLPSVAAEKIPDAAFASEETLIACVGKITGRLDRLKALNLTAENSDKVVAEIAGLPTDDAGETAAKTRIDGIEQAVSHVRKTPVNPLLGMPGASAVQAESAASSEVYF